MNQWPERKDEKSKRYRWPEGKRNIKTDSRVSTEIPSYEWTDGKRLRGVWQGLRHNDNLSSIKLNKIGISENRNTKPHKRRLVT
jgi:hypothetical protein